MEIIEKNECQVIALKEIEMPFQDLLDGMSLIYTQPGCSEIAGW